MYKILTKKNKIKAAKIFWKENLEGDLKLREYLEDQVYMNEDIESIHKIAEQNNWIIYLDENKNIGEQLQKTTKTQMIEIIETLMDELDYYYNLENEMQKEKEA